MNLAFWDSASVPGPSRVGKAFLGYHLPFSSPTLSSSHCLVGPQTQVWTPSPHIHALFTAPKESQSLGSGAHIPPDTGWGRS